MAVRLDDKDPTAAAADGICDSLVAARALLRIAEAPRIMLPVLKV